jgi:hypothetical protein
VARHCPVHETMATLAQVQFQILDQATQAA